MNLVINIFAIFGLMFFSGIIWTIISEKIDNIKSKKSKIKPIDGVKDMENMISKKYGVDCFISFWDKGGSVRVSCIKVGSFLFDNFDDEFTFDNVDNYIRSSFNEMEKNFIRIENDYKSLFRDELRDKKIKELGL
jgi:hypothetical protein